MGRAKKISENPDLEYDISAADMESLWVQYNRRVYCHCLKMLKNPSDAEDLRTEVFLQIFRHWRSFRGRCPVSNWIHRITVNQVLMHWRKTSTKREIVTTDGEMPEIIDPQTNSGNQPIIDRIALMNAMEQLPAGFLDIFTLHDVEGLDHEEISKRRRVHAGTSKSQLHKARTRLRALLTQKNTPKESEEITAQEVALATV